MAAPGGARGRHPDTLHAILPQGARAAARAASVSKADTVSVYTPIARTLKRRGAKRAIWAIASQGLNSGSNFLLSIWVARAVAPTEFGAFSAVYVAVAMCILISRAASNMPMMITYATSPLRFDKAVASDVLGMSLVGGLFVAGIGGIVGLLAGGHLASVSLTAAVAAPGLLLQDCCCYVYFVRQRAASAALNNAIWLGIQVSLFVAATYVWHLHRAWIFLALWGLGAYVSVAVGLAQIGAFPKVARARAWLLAHRAAIVDLTTEATLAQSAQQVVIYVVAVGVNLVGVAAFRAAQVPLGLLRVFFNGLIPIAISEGARLYARNPRSLVAFISIWALGGVAANAALGALLYGMPSSGGELILGASWPLARPILLYITIAAGATAAITSVQSGLRALTATRVSVKLRVPLVVLQLGSTLVGVAFSGLRGAAIGYAAGSVAGACLALVVFRRTFRSMQGMGTGRHRQWPPAGRGATPADLGDADLGLG